jgi:hypothetical protein
VLKELDPNQSPQHKVIRSVFEPGSITINGRYSLITAGRRGNGTLTGLARAGDHLPARSPSMADIP